MADRKISVVVTGDTRGLEKAFHKTEKAADSFGNSLKRAGKVAAIGLAAGVGIAAVVMKKSVDAALEAEKAQTRLDSAFKSTSASAKERAAAMNTVNAVSRQAALDDEDLMDALGRLTRVTGDATKAQTGLQIASDLARARNLSLEASTKIVEKAYLGNVGALKRIGIEIPKVTAAQDALKASGKKATDEQMKAAKAADDTATRQSAIAALQKQYAGAAEAYGKTAAGAQDRFRVAVENLQESLGAKLLPALAKVAGGAATFIENFSKAKGLEAKVKVVLETGKDLLQNAAKIAVDIGAQLQKALGQVDWAAAGVKMASGIGDAFAKSLPIVGQLAGTLAKALSLAIESQNWLQIGREMGVGLKDGFKNGAKNFVKEGGQDVIEAAANPWSFTAKKVAGEVATAFTSSFGSNTKKQLITEKQVAAVAIGQGWDPAIANAVLSGQRIGAGLATGMAAGIAQNAYLASIQAALMVNHAYSAASTAGQMHSPSKLTYQLGTWFVQGFSDGMDGGLARFQPKLANAIKAAVERAQKVVEAARSRMQASFSLLSDKLLRAFDAETGGFRTKTEGQISAIEARRQSEDLATNLESALKSLEQATDAGDSQAIIDAQRAVQRAQEDIQLVSLQKQADQERQAYEDSREAQRTNLENRLTQISTHFEKEGATVKTALAKINKLMRDFGITFAESGQLIGQEFVKGLLKAIGGAAAGAAGVRGAQTGGNPRPDAPIVTQVILDGKVIAETVRKQNATFSSNNAGFVAI